jgi:di/tricarboxylate transporter
VISINSNERSTYWAPRRYFFFSSCSLESAPYAIRGSLGLLLWMSWWWIFEPVHLAVTGLLPLAVLAIFNFLPVATILPAYSEQLVILLIGPTSWRRCGRAGVWTGASLVSLVGLGS